MTQAATLTQQQLQRVLEYTRTRRHYKRNRAIILVTHYAMLRVGEVAALRCALQALQAVLLLSLLCCYSATHVKRL